MGPMAKPPYRFFTPLNQRRVALIQKKHGGSALTDDEARELRMLQRVVRAMIDYRHPMPEGAFDELEAMLDREAERP